MLVQLQQDADFQHWGVDFSGVQHKAQEIGINLIRRPVCTLNPGHALLSCCWQQVKHASDSCLGNLTGLQLNAWTSGPSSLVSYLLCVLTQAQDFDPHSLRHILPAAVNSVYHALDNKQR